MGVAKVVVRNVTAAWVGYAVNIATVFFLTPFVIEHLGAEAYGIWLMLQGIVGYCGLVDVGLRSGMSQTITRHLSEKNEDAVVRYISTAVPVLTGLGIVVVLFATIVGIVLPSVIEIPAEYTSSLLLVIVINSLAFSLQLVFSPCWAVLIGFQRYDIENAFHIISRLLFVIGVIAALEYGTGMLGLAFVTVASTLFDGVARFIRARIMFPRLADVRIRFEWSELRELWKFGIWNSLIHFGRQLIFYSDALVVAWLFNPLAVVPYSLAGSMIEHGNKLVTQAVRVLFPTMAHLRAAKDIATQRKLYLTSTRLIVGVSISMLIGGLFWVDSFLVLWLGEKSDPIIFQQTPRLFIILASASVFVGMHRVGTQLLLANSQVQKLATLYFGEGILNLAMSLICGYIWGLPGVAIGTLVPAALIALIAHVPAHAKVLELSPLNAIVSIVIRPVLFGAAYLCVMLLLYTFLPIPTQWWTLGVNCMATVTVGVMLAFGVLISDQERSGMIQLLPRPARRLFGVARNFW